MQAVREAIIADSDIVAVVDATKWRLKRRYYLRGDSFEEGGHIVPLRRANPVYENGMCRWMMPILVAVSFPSRGEVNLDPGDTAPNAMLLGERIETIFSQKGQRFMPASVKDASIGLTGDDLFSVEQTMVQPGEQFLADTIAAGFEAYAAIVTIDIITVKLDSSSL